MSVLIHMDMPKNCGECWALDEWGDYPLCLITREQGGYKFPKKEQRMGSCPLIEVPEPHGRLIDADKLIELCNIMADKCDSIGESIWNQFATTVEWTPTIIPASEVET